MMSFLSILCVGAKLVIYHLIEGKFSISLTESITTACLPSISVSLLGFCGVLQQSFAWCLHLKLVYFGNTPHANFQQHFHQMTFPFCPVRYDSLDLASCPSLLPAHCNSSPRSSSDVTLCPRLFQSLPGTPRSHKDPTWRLWRKTATLLWRVLPPETPNLRSCGSRSQSPSIQQIPGLKCSQQVRHAPSHPSGILPFFTCVSLCRLLANHREPEVGRREVWMCGWKQERRGVFVRSQPLCQGWVSH